MKTYQVFVYGTLLRGEGNHRVAEPFLLDVKEGVVKGTLYSVGGFPALTLEGDTVVEGEWFTVTEKGLQNMDWLEGYRGEGFNNHYNRVEITDNDGETSGYVYVYTQEQASRLPLIEGGSWRKRARNESMLY